MWISSKSSMRFTNYIKPMILACWKQLIGEMQRGMLWVVCVLSSISTRITTGKVLKCHYNISRSQIKIINRLCLTSIISELNLKINLLSVNLTITLWNLSKFIKLYLSVLGDFYLYLECRISTPKEYV